MESVSRAVGGILGRGGVYRDPMWAVEVELTPLEQRLLRTWWVRRLQFIAHAGAATLTTHQTYTRLEHSLGLFALAAHFAPEDDLARAAALLHDVGHLPFSHTFEGVAGLQHHQLGEERIQDFAPLLAQHGLAADDVLATGSGKRPSVLHAFPGALKLDHLESFVRSGRAHGRLAEPPTQTLSHLRLVDGAVDTDRVTAEYLAELAVGEARYLCSWEDAVANAVIRGLVKQLLEQPAGDPGAGALRSRIPQMTDDELWGVLLADPRTVDHAQRLRQEPLGWKLLPGHGHDREDGYLYALDHLHLDTPCVAGEPVGLPSAAANELPDLPWHCTVVPSPTA